MRKFNYFLFMLFLLLAFFLVRNSQATELKIAGGAAPMNNVWKPQKEFIEKQTGIVLKLFEIGPKGALEDLLKGNIDVACAGLSFEDWAQMMKRESDITIKKEDFKIFEIGRDNIVVFVHPSNPVSALTKEQLKGIFTGKIVNWKDVGGKDIPILIVWGRLIPGTNSLFIKHILDGEAPTKEVLEVNTANDIVDAVVNSPEGIGFGPEAVKEKIGLKILQTPPISRPILCLTRGNPTPLLIKVFELIKAKPLN